MEANEDRLERVRSYFRGDLLILREALLRMASLAHTNLSIALESLVERDPAKAAKAIADDQEIDRLEVEVDEMVAGFMATQAPMALACRLMLAAR